MELQYVALSLYLLFQSFKYLLLGDEEGMVNAAVLYLGKESIS